MSFFFNLEFQVHHVSFQLTYNFFNFSPAGWDNMKKISILYENLQSMKPDEYYRDMIVQPPSNRKVSSIFQVHY